MFFCTKFHTFILFVFVYDTEMHPSCNSQWGTCRAGRWTSWWASSRRRTPCAAAAVSGGSSPPQTSLSTLPAVSSRYCNGITFTGETINSASSVFKILQWHYIHRWNYQLCQQCLQDTAMALHSQVKYIQVDISAQCHINYFKTI